MKILAVIQPDVRIDIKDNYNEALKYMVDHGAPFNLEYVVKDIRIKDMATYTQTVKGYDVVFLNYSPNLEKRHDCYTNPVRPGLVAGIMPCGIEEDTDKHKWLSLSIAHELMHAIAWTLETKFGIKTNVNQIMDTYYKNLDWNAPDGNFAQCWAILKPYMSLLWPNLKQNSIQETTSLSKWGLLPSLEKKAQQLIVDAKNAGYSIKITHGYRDPAYQDKLYAQGRTTPGKIVTYATGKTSKHCQRKAFDICLAGKDPYPKNFDWKKIGVLGEALGLRWGGKFKNLRDYVHFEI